MVIKEQIEIDLATAFETLNLDRAQALVSTSAMPICDYQCNACFALSKQLQEPPLFLAQRIARAFKSKVATANASAPGFINFVVTDTALAEYGIELLSSSSIPLARPSPRKIFFDYGGANIAKELHIGHLRSPIVGEAIRRVFSALGHETIADVYFGDFGLQNGLILAELEHQKFIKSGKFIKEITLDVLNEVYPYASKKKNTDSAFKARADEITLLVQRKKKPWYTLWQQMRDISVAKICENYKVLNCTFDLFRGESHASPYVKEVLDILKDKNLAYISDNSLIMDVAKEGEHIPIKKTSPNEPQRYENPMPPIILQKSGGGDLYATNDVATLYYRAREFNMDEIVYITDARQELHFKQVFRCVTKGGLVPETLKLTHVGYGTMNGKDGRPFKTRSGGTIRLEEVVQIVTDVAQKRLAENGRDANNMNLARAIGLSALKFADLSNNVRKDYVFDIEKFTAFEGKTGPYVLYTIARINSIFRKLKAEPPKKLPEIANIQPARIILVKILKLTDAISTASSTYTLNGIVDATYAVASDFNLFYANNNILKQADKDIRNSYLAICKFTKIALEFAMNILAIDTVEEM